MHLRIIPAALLLTALLCACAAAPDEGQRTLDLRAAFLAAPGCSGQMDLVADYGERVYEYAAAFETDEAGTLSIALTAPEEVAGITATVAQGQTALRFDGVRLETGPLDPTGLSRWTRCPRSWRPCAPAASPRPDGRATGRAPCCASAAGTRTRPPGPAARPSSGSTRGTR